MLTSSRREVARLTRTRPEKPKAPLDPRQPDPVLTTGIPLEKAKHCRELHMGGKGLVTLHPNLLRFSNLEVLWLNNNKLSSLEGVLPPDTGRVDVSFDDKAYGARRLKQLYLSNNVLKTLEGDVEKLKYLEVLMLANNQLRNLEEICQTLAQLKNLTQLDLFGNPCAEEVNYQLYVVHKIPQLELFDRHQITPAERIQAAKLFDKSSKSTSNYAFFSTAPVTCNAVTLNYNGKRWRRVWHQVAGNKGTFDVRCSQIMEIASRSSQVHIRTAMNPSQSVTSKPGSYPIQRLKAGRCISCKPNGQRPTKDDVSRAWEGDRGLKKCLWSDATEDGYIADRPLTRVLYYTPGENGLRLTCPSTGEGECCWRTGQAEAVEVYIDVGIEGDDKVSDMSLSVWHLQGEVQRIRQKDYAVKTKEASKHRQKTAALEASRDRFHELWESKKAKADDGPVIRSKQADDCIDAATKAALGEALAALKRPVNDKTIQATHEALQKEGQTLSCLYRTLPVGEAYQDHEPLVPERDGDTFEERFTEHLESTAEGRATAKAQEAVNICFAADELEAIGNSLGAGDQLGESMLKRGQVLGVVQLCTSNELGPHEDAITAFITGRMGGDELSVYDLIVLLTKNKVFVEHVAEKARKEAAAMFQSGDAAGAAAKHAKMNRLSTLLAEATRGPGTSGVRRVGAYMERHSAGLAQPTGGRAAPTNPSGPRVYQSPRKKDARSAKFVEPDATSPTQPPVADPPAAAKERYIASGHNPKFGYVGAGYDYVQKNQRKRDAAKVALVAAMAVLANGAVRQYKLPPLPHAPWG
eukprot:TRINITY_DN32141_c0_g1_i1.p2 TRINITY_DN32141_c0_g1~~TRINITY_DN32141_c0_g1_i1.p2  ORF type:complete len:808 (+),score=293.56 TRINITY_DN32141_c0_g1_i1:164-2587(+)